MDQLFEKYQKGEVFLTYKITSLSCKSNFFKVYLGNIPIGVCYLEKLSGGIIYISSFLIYSNWRGKGLSKKMLDLITEFSKEENCGYLKLSVMDDNLIAIRLYESYGFVFFGINKSGFSKLYIKKIN